MEFSNLELKVESGIALLTLNRPAALNALDSTTLDELDRALDFLGDAPEVRALVLTGAGDKAFVAGADIRELSSLTPLSASRHAAKGQALFDKLESSGKPSIAAVNGFALGGGLELAMACSIRLASTNARLGLPEITLGLIPGFAGTQRLSRLVGRGRALHLILTGKPIQAEAALAMGLVSEVCEPERLLPRALELAGQIATYSAPILALAEMTVRQGAEMAYSDATAFEAAQFGVAFATEDAREGMAAFLEKRKPSFRGR